jgi:hypothetical protein
MINSKCVKGREFKVHTMSEEFAVDLGSSLRWGKRITNGFGGLAVSILASGIQDRGFEAEAVGFFGLKNPQHAFLRRGSKAVCPMPQICGM